MFRVLAILALTLAFVTASNVPSNSEIVLFPGGAPNETLGWPGQEVRKSDDGTGCGVNHSSLCDHIFNVSVPTLVPFLVTNGTGAAVIIAPGGGYADLSWSKEGLDVARMYNSLGVSAFVLKYRVPARPSLDGLPKWWAPLQDAQRAMSLVRAGAEKWGLDPSQIGFTGFSAGGHLAAHISTAWRQRIYPRVDHNDDVSCRPDFSLLLYPWMILEHNKKEQPWVIASELDDIRSDHPVSFFCQNEDDNTALLEGSFAYYLKMREAKAPLSDLRVYPKGGHGFGLCQGFPQREEVCAWPQEARRFLQDRGFLERHAQRGLLV